MRIPVAEAAVCVVPIRQGGGTRLKILEAMALGTPVVATSKGAEGLDAVDGEHLLLADDPATFANRTTGTAWQSGPAPTPGRQRPPPSGRSLRLGTDWTEIREPGRDRFLS